ncbi:MAG: hypothetical protein QXW01_03630, partial [Candidatus Aenigmatarchaeota archaeon]
TITVTSSSSAQAGTYSFTVRATNNQATSYYGQGSANYNVVSSGLPSLPSCSQVSPNVIINPPIVFPGGTLNITINITCNEWNFNSVRNLTLSLKINNIPWNDCFINEKGLVTNFGWSGSEQDVASRSCKRGDWTSNGKWYCYNSGVCKHKEHALYVYSDSSNGNVILNFVCQLPRNLTPGAHSLTVGATIYASEINTRPAKTGFLVFGIPFPQVLLHYINLFKKVFIPL